MTEGIVKYEEQEKQLAPQMKSEIVSYLDSLGNNLNEFHKIQFIGVCRELQLNPIKREIYGIPYKDRNGKVTFSIIVGYEVYIKRAEKTGLLEGWKVWTEKDGSEIKACIEINRSDWKQPFYHEVYYSEYVQSVWKNGTKTPNKFWSEKPRTMIKKVCIGQGFRLCFTDACGSIPYLREELDIDGEPKDLEPKKENPFSQAVEVEPENVSEERAKVETAGAGKVEEANTEKNEMSVNETRNFIKKSFVPTDKAIRFFLKKAWINEGETLDNFSDNQVRRLGKNFKAIFSLFDKFEGGK